VTIGAEQPFCVIGERINPTGRKAFAQELRDGDVSTVTLDALAQVEAGANMLDINAGIPLVDEPELLKAMLRAAQEAVDVPICIDSSVIEALEAGLSTYEGKALVNSVTAEDERLEAILPLVERYGAAVIALPNDENEIPEQPERRLELARKIVEVATGTYVLKTLDTISLLHSELGVNMTLGASNVSFGMPDRETIGATFLCTAMRAGLTSAIMDARSPQLVRAVKAADLLLDRDPWGASWIAAHRSQQATAGP
jgi:5-methyltetrahydrofolate--homocysteine methyltransferase